ncbi:hypothetical protein HAX54_016103 [Datura stramonium]|uniref:Uncharacterized protein n=1 Tax=Datura stramonium TaxID=4076 RepID=A0ABS8RZS7_DATST|nr:hypothetical protein [Datura stramonium]
MSALGIDDIYLALALGKSRLLDQVSPPHPLLQKVSPPGFEFSAKAASGITLEELTCNHHYHTIDHPRAVQNKSLSTKLKIEKFDYCAPWPHYRKGAFYQNMFQGSISFKDN